MITDIRNSINKIKQLNESFNKQYAAIYIGSSNEISNDKLYNLYESTNISISTPQGKSKYYWFRPTNIVNHGDYSTADYTDGGFINGLSSYSKNFKDNLTYIKVTSTSLVLKLIERSVPENKLPPKTIIIW